MTVVADRGYAPRRNAKAKSAATDRTLAESIPKTSKSAEPTARGRMVKAAARKDDHVRARIETAVKQEAEAVLAAIGLTVSDAMRLMLHRVVEERRLPFDPLIPNEATIAAIRTSRRDEVIKVGSPRDLMAALDAD